METDKKAKNNKTLILKFLAEEQYSTAVILANLVGLKQVRSVYKILKILESEKLIRHKKLDKIEKLYALTALGYSFVNDECKDYKSFSFSEVKPLSLPHKFAVQECKVAMIKNGVIWESKKGKREKNQIRPDGIIWYQFGNEELQPIAIEVELTAKTRKRYKEIFNLYQYESHKQKEYSYILYLVTNELMKNRLQKIFEDISSSPKIHVTTMDLFKDKFNKADLDSRLDDIDKRRKKEIMDKILKDKHEQAQKELQIKKREELERIEELKELERQKERFRLEEERLRRIEEEKEIERYDKQLKMLKTCFKVLIPLSVILFIILFIIF